MIPDSFDKTDTQLISQEAETNETKNLKTYSNKPGSEEIESST